MKNKLLYPTLLLILLFQVSCIAFTKSKTKGSLSFYESYFINDSTTQFFIKPLKFKSNTKRVLMVDFTFRSSKSTKTNVVMNFSVIGDSTMLPLHSFTIKADEKQIFVPQSKLLFKEKRKQKYHYRYSSEIDFEAFRKMFGAQIQIYEIGNYEFEAGERAKKIIYQLNRDLINFQLGGE